MSTRARRREPSVPAPPKVTLVPTPPLQPPDTSHRPERSSEATVAADDLTTGYAHPTIHARAVHGGAWKILSSWARAS